MRAFTRAMAQTPAAASRIAISPFLRAVSQSEAISDLLTRYHMALMTQVRQTSLCKFGARCDLALEPVILLLSTVSGEAARTARQPPTKPLRASATKSLAGHSINFWRTSRPQDRCGAPANVTLVRRRPSISANRVQIAHLLGHGVFALRRPGRPVRCIIVRSGTDAAIAAVRSGIDCGRRW